MGMFSKIVSFLSFRIFLVCPNLEFRAKTVLRWTKRDGRAQVVLSRLIYDENLKMRKESNELCEIYYEEFHGIKDFSLVNNTYIAAGGQGMVFKCECFQEGIYPNVTAQKGTN